MKLDKKQRIILIITILAMLFLAWQIYDMVAGDVVPTPAASTQTKTAPSHSAATTNNAPTAHSVAATHNTATATTTNKTPVLQQKTITPSAQLTAERRQYLQIADQLALANMRNQLLQKQVAIAKASHQIAQLNSQASAYTSNTNADSSLPPNVNGMHLSYLAAVGGQWTATVSENGNYQNVSVGSLLANGSVVTAINKAGVQFRQAGHTKIIGFNGVRIMPNSFSSMSSSASSSAQGDATATLNNSAQAQQQLASALASVGPAKTSSETTASQRRASLSKTSLSNLNSASKPASTASTAKNKKSFW